MIATKLSVLVICLTLAPVLSDPPLNTIPLANQCQLQAFNNIQQAPLKSSTTPREWSDAADRIVEVYGKATGSTFPAMVLYNKDKEGKHKYPKDYSDIDDKDDKKWEDAHAGWYTNFAYQWYLSKGYISHPAQTYLDKDPCYVTGHTADLSWSSYHAFADDSNSNAVVHKGKDDSFNKEKEELTRSQLKKWVDDGVFGAIAMTVIVAVYPHISTVIQHDGEFWYLDNNQHKAPVPSRKKGFNNKAGKALYNLNNDYRVTDVFIPKIQKGHKPVYKYMLQGKWYKAKDSKAATPEYHDVKMEYSHKIGNFDDLVKWALDKVNRGENDGGTKSYVVWTKPKKPKTKSVKQIVQEFCEKCDMFSAKEQELKDRKEKCKQAMSEDIVSVRYVPQHYAYLLELEAFIIVMMFICIICVCFIGGGIFGFMVAGIQK